MKNITKKIVMSIGVLEMIFGSLGQASAAPYTFPSIATPFYITKKADMNIADLAVPPNKESLVILAPDNTLTLDRSNKTRQPAKNIAATAACFTITGLPDYTYAITIPTMCTLTDGQGHSIKVTYFSSSPSVTGTLNSGGFQELHMGAALSIPAAQTPGDYTNSSEVLVTINYN